MNAPRKIANRILGIAAAVAVMSPPFPDADAQAVGSAGPAKIPRIALALSGGGARGLAHVGVLKVLDEMRIPIACVAGTSMGSIVGATFAAGTTPEAMEKFVVAADWDKVFRDQPPREEISVRRKKYDYETLFAPEFGVKDGGLALPKGVLSGVSIESFFRELTTPAFGITDFNKLRIPFRAMATDIETGQSIVLDHGSLAQAMRASMSVPGAMSPVEIDGRLLVDGGIANNLPIEVARKLCDAEAVIAVNISTPPLTRKEITSALSVVGQLINFLGKDTVDKQLQNLKPGDVLIAPDLGDISAGTFDRSKDAIRIGEEATREAADKLKRYSIAPEQYAAVRARQIAEPKALGTVQEIRVEGVSRTNPDVAKDLVETKPGEPLSEEKIAADLRRIYGRGDYESVTYRIIGDATGPRAMVIQPTEKSYGPDYLRFGLGLASDLQGDNQFNALVQYRKTWVNSLGAEWVTEAQVGQDTHLTSEFYQPFSATEPWFVAPNVAIGQQSRGVFVNGQKVATYLIGVGEAGVDLGAVLGTWGELRVGPVWSKVFARVDTGSPVLPEIRQTTAGIRANLFVDQTNYAWFPTDGFGANASGYAAFTGMGSAQSYQKLEGTVRYAKSWGPHTLQLNAAGGTGFGSNMPAYETFTLGGPLRLSGYRVNEFSGQEYWFGRAMFYDRVIALPDLIGSGVFAGVSAEIGKIKDRFDQGASPGTLWSGSVFLGADTFAGPGFLGFGFGGGGNWSLYLLLGSPK